jgi:hypothetical protein
MFYEIKLGNGPSYPRLSKELSINTKFLVVAYIYPGFNPDGNFDPKWFVLPVI